MKISKFAFAMTIMVISLISCQKDDEPKGDEPKFFAGTWEGKYGYENETPSYYEKWDLEENGDLKAFLQDGTLYAVGSWMEDGDKIEAHYVEEYGGDSYRHIGTYDAGEDKITGNWYDTEDPTYGGTFEMKRK